MTSKQILIVDDEPGLPALERALRKRNPDWRTWSVGSATKALEMIADTQYDLIITDWKFDAERLSGTDVLKAAKKRDPLVMVILISAYQGEGLDRYEDALRLGAFDVIDRTDPAITLNRELAIKGESALRIRATAADLALFARHIDGNVVERFRRDRSSLKFVARELTIMFCDIRGFSKINNLLMAENRLVANFLRMVYEATVRVAHDRNGIVDKFMGDGSLLIFGANPSVDSPREDVRQTHIRDANNAVLAALDLQAEIAPVIDWFRAEYENIVSTPWEEIALGIGIHFTNVMVGIIETQSRDQFTALGHGVNLAKRFESAAGRTVDGHKFGNILISQTVKMKLGDKFVLKDEGVLPGLRNIDGKQLAWSVISTRDTSGD